MSSQKPIFQASKVSLIDIDRLIDVGLRFDLKVECAEDELFEDIEEYISRERDEEYKTV